MCGIKSHVRREMDKNTTEWLPLNANAKMAGPARLLRKGPTANDDDDVSVHSDKNESVP